MVNRVTVTGLVYMLTCETCSSITKFRVKKTLTHLRLWSKTLPLQCIIIILALHNRIVVERPLAFNVSCIYYLKHSFHITKTTSLIGNDNAFQVLFRYRLIEHWRLNLGLPWPHVNLYFRVNRKWDHISRTTQPMFHFFSVIRSFEHWRLNLGNREPMLTFTSGSIGSGTISQELHNWFSIFSVIDSLALEIVLW